MSKEVCEKKDVVIVGGGPAGLAAACQLYKLGITDIVILEREKNLGGILRQCIHDGFGLTRFKELLSGPEYAQRFISIVQKEHIPYRVNTSVIAITKDRVVTASSPEGLIRIEAKAVILAMGCRERTRGALQIPGERPAGVFTAGVAQAYINLYNRKIGKEVVILGSGDIGLIMARRLTLEGVHVKAVYEVMSVPSGLPRNIHQCLEDFNIPLYLSHTVTAVHGSSRITGVTIAQVDEKLRPIPGTEQEVSCDTLILSVGLIPENDLSTACGVAIDGKTKGAVVTEQFETSIPGIFSAGNVLHVHDLVDNVSIEAEKAADCVAAFIKEGSSAKNTTLVDVIFDGSIGNVVPQKITGTHDVTLFLRVRKEGKDQRIVVRQNGKEVFSRKAKHVTPAVMEQLTLQRDVLSAEYPLEVSVQ